MRWRIGDAFSKKLEDDVLFQRFAFGFIFFAVLLSYYPALYFPPRADQVTYLAETANKQQPWDLIFGCYDLNRHTIYSLPDKPLFRPLLYMFLGSEQVILGHHFWAWQLMGIFAHLTLVWILLRLLWHLSGPWLGFAGTWLFALSVSNYELVSWPHLTSYIFMLCFIVLTIEQVIFCIEANELAWSRLARMVIYLSLACFIYETSGLFTLCILALLIIHFPKNIPRAILLIIPVILYVLFSVYNYVFVNHLLKTVSICPVPIEKWLTSIIDTGSWWLYAGLFNGMYSYAMASRTMFQPHDAMVFKPLAFNNLQVVLELIVLLAYGGLVWICQSFAKRTKLLIALGGMLCAYIAVIVIGRYDEMGGLEQAIRINSYYLYPFWVIITIMAFSLIKANGKLSRLGRCYMIIFVTASFVLGLWEGKKINSLASSYSDATNNTILLVTTLDLLIQEKRNEPDFSFYVDPEYQGNSVFPDLNNKIGPSYQEYSFAELLYPQYFRPKESAKYKFLVRPIFKN